MASILQIKHVLAIGVEFGEQVEHEVARPRLDLHIFRATISIVWGLGAVYLRSTTAKTGTAGHDAARPRLDLHMFRSNRERFAAICHTPSSKVSHRVAILWLWRFTVGEITNQLLNYPS